ncbi:ArsR/SmtB family transcription factor [Sporomusa acidovorans]|uniref:ArsR/SmtB family transcription factor n=1 Tax=Sporomusa acidovorans TaxID=112900 RepID=UPI0035A12CF8
MRVGVYELRQVLKALADSNRIAIMCCLQSGKKCVCEIEQILSVSQSATSKHLNRLRMVGLIEAEKTAQWVYYSIQIAYTRIIHS